MFRPHRPFAPAANTLFFRPLLVIFAYRFVDPIIHRDPPLPPLSQHGTFPCQVMIGEMEPAPRQPPAGRLHMLSMWQWQARPSTLEPGPLMNSRSTSAKT